MGDTSTNMDIAGSLNSEELLELYNEDPDDFKKAIQDEVDKIAGDDGIDEDEQKEIDEWLSKIDEVGAAWDELLEGLEDANKDDMTDAEVAQKEGYEEEAKEIMDVLQEAISVGEDRVETINESFIEIGDERGSVTADENTETDLTVQLDGSPDPFDDDSNDLLYNVVDETGANILEEGRIPVTINTPELTLQSYDGSTIVFTYEGKDENGDAVQRKITINNYDHTKYVIYFEGDSITSDMVDNGTLANWHTDILGSSIFGDDQWSLNVRVNGPSAWPEFVDLTSDANISQTIGNIPEAAGLSEAIKDSWKIVWQAWIDGDVDKGWAEVVGQYSEEQQKALIEAMVVSMSLDADLVEFFPTFFDSYGPTLQGLLDVDYENPTTSGLLGLMLIEENTTAGASLGGPSLYPSTLFGDETIEGEVKSPDMNIPIDAINNVMDIQAIAGQPYASSLDDALEIQEGIRDDGGYFSISDTQYDDMVTAAMTLNNIEETNSGVTESNLKNALIQALAQFKEMGMTTVEDARINFLTVVNSVAASFGPTYLDDITAGLLFLLMKVDGGTSGKENCSSIYESLVGNGEDADSLLFMSQIEPLINNGSVDIDADGDGVIDSTYDANGDGILDVDINGDGTIDSNDYSYDGLPNFYSDITEDFNTRGGYTFETLPTTATIANNSIFTGNLIVDGAMLGALLGGGIGLFVGGALGALVGGIAGGLIGGAIGLVGEAVKWGAEAVDNLGNALDDVGDWLGSFV